MAWKRDRLVFFRGRHTTSHLLFAPSPTCIRIEAVSVLICYWRSISLQGLWVIEDGRLSSNAIQVLRELSPPSQQSRRPYFNRRSQRRLLHKRWRATEICLLVIGAGVQRRCIRKARRHSYVSTRTRLMTVLWNVSSSELPWKPELLDYLQWRIRRSQLRIRRF